MQTQKKPKRSNASAPAPAPPPTPMLEELARQKAEQRKEQARREAWSLKHLAIPAALAHIVGEQNAGVLGAKAWFNTFLGEAGNPTDPVEAILLQQLLLAHHRLAELHMQAAHAPTPEHIKILNGAAARLLGELRRLALSIRLYRTPPSNRSFSVVHQQNVVAAGSQQVQYVDQSSPAESSVSLKVSDRGELAGNQAREANHDSDLRQAEEPPSGGRWADQRLQAATVDD